MKMHLKISSAKERPMCLHLSTLTYTIKSWATHADTNFALIQYKDRLSRYRIHIRRSDVYLFIIEIPVLVRYLYIESDTWLRIPEVNYAIISLSTIIVIIGVIIVLVIIIITIYQCEYTSCSLTYLKKGTWIFPWCHCCTCYHHYHHLSVWIYKLFFNLLEKRDMNLSLVSLLYLLSSFSPFISVNIQAVL